MKFSRLISKFEEFTSKWEQGSSVDPEKLEKLQQLLSDKISRYEAKLANNQNPGKQSKLETRLKVVQAQLEKSKNL
jgi:hypothetical protein